MVCFLLRNGMKYFVTSHKPLETPPPYMTHLIGVEGFDPGDKGVAAGNVLTRGLDLETGLGALRALMPMNHCLEKSPDDEPIFTGSYRLFLGKESTTDWLSPILQENKCVTTADFASSWKDLIALEIPDDVDMLIPSPRLLPDTVLGQYMRVHVLEDLLHAVACAIETGFLDPVSVPYMLQSNTLIPYAAGFASSTKMRRSFNESLWETVMEFYRKHYVQRSGYQRRVMDFVFERVVSMHLVQKITKEGLRCRACRNIWVTDDGKYAQST